MDALRGGRAEELVEISLNGFCDSGVSALGESEGDCRVSSSAMTGGEASLLLPNPKKEPKMVLLGVSGALSLASASSASRGRIKPSRQLRGDCGRTSMECMTENDREGGRCRVAACGSTDSFEILESDSLVEGAAASWGSVYCAMMDEKLSEGLGGRGSNTGVDCWVEMPE